MLTLHASGRELVLFAQVGFFVRPDFCLPVVALIIVVGLGIWVIWRWRTGLAEEPPPSLDQQIEHYSQMVERGELDSQEFARIVAQLEKQAAGADAPHEDVEPPKDDQPPDTSIREM